MIDTVMPLLVECQVILLCDSWYSKGIIIETVKKYDNLELIAAVRCDTVLYDLPPALTDKRGKARLYGDKIDIKNLSYEKVGEYYAATKKVLTNLFEKLPVIITVAVKNLESFDSVRIFISTIAAAILIFSKSTNWEVYLMSLKRINYLPYFTYSIR
ncbi:MAG: superfamily endonuclease [Caloramator sp.]|jgi:hypothetical protein|uniref:hypothetical protein n=1 Tax=Caloramator sp. TaxID=1871330 RepID=UPI001DF28CCF|nr:superfamily endonuclease [Caloramator sp.]